MKKSKFLLGRIEELEKQLAESQPTHPTALTTLEDYEQAPIGTIVAEGGDLPVMKNVVGAWVRYGRNNEFPATMAGTTRRVLRWGW